MLSLTKSRFSGKKLFLFLQLIFTITVFPQGWNNTVTTSINVSNFIGMDLCTNRNGNNLAVLNWNGEFSQIYYVNYYLLNSSGTIIRSSTIETLGPNQGSIEYVNISGNNDKVYVVYKINGVIRAKKSTDAGVSWTTYDLTNPAGSGGFDYVDIAFDNITNKLHVVYARGSFGYPDQVTHYYSLNPDDQWGEYQQVSDYGDEWTTPTVSFSQNRIHVSYHEDGALSRDKYLTSWQTPATLSSSSLIERIHAGSSKLFYFYAETQPGLYANMYVKQRNLSGSSWSSPTLLHEYTDFDPPFVSATNSSDGKTHIVYHGPGSAIYRNYNGSTWSSELTIGDWYENNLISSTSNDLFVMWMGSNNYIKYRQYDANPLTPSNFLGTIYNNHPKITWSANSEPDLDYYEIWKKGGNEGGDWHIKTTTTNTNYTDNDELVVTGPPGANEGTVYYKIKAVDVENHKSGFSAQVNMRVSIDPPSKTIGGTSGNIPMEFGIMQNYPNPFNPTTSIRYQLSKDGYVTLKVYNMLGEEVVDLVNEFEEAGYYSIHFDASDLPSGMYFYKIQAGDFSDIKKMLLLK